MTIIVTIYNLKIAGQIIWKRGTRFGVRFDEPLAFNQVGQIVRGEAPASVRIRFMTDKFGRPLPALKQTFRRQV